VLSCMTQLDIRAYMPVILKENEENYESFANFLRVKVLANQN